jgi:Ssp1 endopeptidase immunity protein Rap1a
MRANNKTLLIILALSLALFGDAVTTGSSEARELKPEKLLFFTGNDVHSWCQSDPTLATGYTAGLWDQSARAFNSLTLSSGLSVQTDALIALQEKLTAGYCEPPHVTVQQVTDVFCAFLRDKPEKRSAPAAMLFTEAMQRVWPCDKP